MHVFIDENKNKYNADSKNLRIQVVKYTISSYSEQLLCSIR